MQRRLYGICFEDFLAGLAERGYHKASDKEPCLRWRRHHFHVILQHKQPGKVMISLHIDIPISIPPFHRTIKSTKMLIKEFEAIMESYKKVRRKRGEGKHEVSPTA